MNIPLPAPAFESVALAAPLFLLGILVEFFWGRKWRTLGQRIAGTFTYTACPPLVIFGLGLGVSWPVAFLLVIAFYEGAKRTWTLTEIRSATAVAPAGTRVLVLTDDGALLKASRLHTCQPIARGQLLRVSIRSSYAFGWRLSASVL